MRVCNLQQSEVQVTAVPDTNYFLFRVPLKCFRQEEPLLQQRTLEQQRGRRGVQNQEGDRGHAWWHYHPYEGNTVPSPKIKGKNRVMHTQLLIYSVTTTNWCVLWSFWYLNYYGRVEEVRKFLFWSSVENQAHILDNVWMSGFTG